MKLVTTALTYANGPVHLGHMVEAIQADIYCRFLRFCKEDVIFISGSDSHGTPIMLQANKLETSPEVLIEEMRLQHARTFSSFDVKFDTYHTTHSDHNKSLTYQAYDLLKTKKVIIEKTIEQAYDSEREMFLPDRFVKGNCPKCDANDQYGDNCEKCGASYHATELKNAYSTLSGNPPITKQSLHDFFALSKSVSMLQQWQHNSRLQPEVKNKLSEWFDQGLSDWDITRDHPYFGFQHPERKDQYFYVWLDAPIGYFAAVKALDEEKGTDYLKLCLQSDSDLDVIHFIGKDIAYFHGLFWPAVLKECGWKQPSELWVHGFLTINGQKMSKSRGTFILADDYLNVLPSDYMRYYVASKLGDSIADIDLNLDDFRVKINADIVGKLVNIGSRCAKIIHQSFGGCLANSLLDASQVDAIKKALPKMKSCYESRQFSQLLRLVMQLTDGVNQFIDQHKPWKLVKEESTVEVSHQVCTQALVCFYQLMGVLQPVMPRLTHNAFNLFETSPDSWDDLTFQPLGQTLKPFERLAERITSEQTDRLLEPQEG
ncbi:MAG TPA: methionine--tRNA ligase [Gammaproteobacteria bacterium]|nr:methionine--tRNA ligase [Gammaproteobacteria bacterium]